jgi:hypothetical protein
MTNYDPRIARAFAVLGYDTFPFEAFDEDGDLRVPGDLPIPEHYKQTLGIIAASPVWSELYRAISQLANSDWRCYMGGLAFPGDAIRVTVFKAMSTVSDPESAHQWALSYSGTIAKTLSDYAGRSYLVDPSWAKALAAIIGELPDNQKQGDPTDPLVAESYGHTVQSEAWSDRPGELPIGTRDAASGVPPLFLLALRAVSAVVSNLTVRTKVLTTVVWYPAGTEPPVDGQRAAAWIPLHNDYADWHRRTLHMTWNPQGPQPTGSTFWSGNEVKWHGLGVLDMPHEPWQWCRAFYPNINCGGPQEVADPELAPRVASLG